MKDLLGLMLLPLIIPLIIFALIAVQVKAVVELFKDWRATTMSSYSNIQIDLKGEQYESK